MRRLVTLMSAFGLVLAGLNIFTSPASAGLGDLDSGFGTGGRVQLASPYSGDADGHFTTGAMQRDGKILAAGVSTNGDHHELVAARFLPNGGLDTSFGSGGFARHAVNGDDVMIKQLAIAPDGKLVASGSATSGTDAKSLVIRLLATGALDTSFNGTGIWTQNVVAGGAEILASAAAFSDNSIIAVGGADVGSGQGGWNPLVVRIATDGSSASVNTGSHGGASDVVDRFSDVGIGPDGFATMAGTVNGSLLLVKVKPGAGVTLDSDATFGSSGVVITSPGHTDFANPRISVGGQKKPVVSASAKLPGAGDTDTVLLRFEPSGWPDRSLGSGGVSRAAAVAGRNDAPTSVVLSGSYVFISKDLASSSADGVVQRYNYGGSLDATFKEFSNGAPIAGMTLLLADGKPVGIYTGPEGARYALFRLSITADPLPPPPPVAWAGLDAPRKVRARNFDFVHGRASNVTGVEVAIRRVNPRLLRRQHLCPWINAQGWIQRVPAQRVARRWQCSQLWVPAQGTSPWVRSFAKLPPGKYFVLVRPMTATGPGWPSATKTIRVTR